MAKTTEIFMALDVNAQTGKVIKRELNAEELAFRLATISEAVAQEAEATARIDARISALAKLAKLGLTQAEIEAL